MRSWVLVSLCAGLLLSISTARGDDNAAQLGSTDWKPSAEHPVGWRGDSSGKYPGATPPTQWGRWAKTSIREVRCQAAKPKGADGTSGEALPFGRVENWLIVGPFAVEDPAKAFDDELVAKEAELQPDTGDKAGEKVWTAFKAGGDNQHGGAGLSGVEFYRALGRPTGSVVAYAHTYLYAPAATKVTLRVGMPTAMKFWLNGKQIASEAKAPYANSKAIEIELAQGWNRLLAKHVSTIKEDKTGDSVKAWRFTATLAPTDKSFSYESNNIAWMLPMPAPSTSLPIVVGDKLLVTSNYADLLCVNKADGRILWLRSNSYYDVMSDGDKAKVKELEPEAAKLRDMNEQVVKELNALISAAGPSSEQSRVLNEKLSAKNKQDIKINDMLVKAGITKRPPHIQHVGSANGTPVSDGQHVWAVFGGGTYSGPLTVVCYDLDGKRIWARGWPDVDAGEHGDHCSPVLADGKLVVQTIRELRVLDATTGQDVWSAKAQGNGDNGGGSPVVQKIGGEGVIIGPRRDMWRLRDGKLLHLPQAPQLGHGLQTPVIDKGVIYQITGWGSANYTAFKLPDAAGDALKPEMLYQVPVDKKYADYTFTNSFVGSLLVHEGLVYGLTEGGVLHVFDAATGKAVYVRMLDEMRTRVQWVFYNGACGSPALAGKYLYLTDDNGITVVMEPGREFKKVAVNTLEAFGDGFSPEQTLGTPIFEGKFMYYRTPGYLYCVGGK